jgi:hypothetical protein
MMSLTQEDKKKAKNLVFAWFSGLYRTASDWCLVVVLLPNLL